MDKQFWGYNDKEEARIYWGNVVDQQGELMPDGTTRIELPNDVIRF